MPFETPVDFDDDGEVARLYERLDLEQGQKFIEVREPTRSEAQNNRYWKLVTILAAELSAHEGQRWTKDDTHEFAKANWLPLVEHVHPITGNLVMLPKSTTKLTKPDFSVLMEKVEALLDWLRSERRKSTTRKAV